MSSVDWKMLSFQRCGKYWPPSRMDRAQHQAHGGEESLLSSSTRPQAPSPLPLVLPSVFLLMAGDEMFRWPSRVEVHSALTRIPDELLEGFASPTTCLRAAGMGNLARCSKRPGGRWTTRLMERERRWGEEREG